MLLFTLDSVIVLLYLAVTLAVGIYSGRNINSIKEYAIGNYKFSTSTLTATITATWIGAGLLLGIHEKVYQQGIIWLFIFLGGVIDIFIFQIISKKIFRFKGCFSAAEILGKWYGPEARTIGGICIALYSIGTIAIQVAAIGYLFKEFFGISPVIGIIVGAGIVVLYSSFGGIKSVTYTDVIQFCFFIIAVPIIAIVIINKAGGYSTVLAKLPAEHLKLIPNYSKPIEYITMLLFFSIPFCDACLIQRVLMAKDERQVAVSFRATAIVMVLFYLVCLQIALSVYSINPTLNPNTVLYYVINNYLPIGIKGLGIAGVLAVIMSSADSYLNASSVAIISDVINPLRENKLTNKQEVIIIRLTTFFIGSTAILFATTSESITKLMINAWMFWAPVAVVPLYAAIFGVKSNLKVFLISAATGMTFVTIWELLDLTAITNLENSVPAVLISFLAFVTSTLYFKYFSPTSLIVPNLNSGEDSEKLITKIIRRKYSRIINYIRKLSIDNCINFVCNISASRVNYFGAQYKSYGTFAIASFLVPYFMWSNNQGTITVLSHDISIFIRFIAGILSFGLITYDMWPEKKLKYLPIYWHFTLMYSLPFLTTFLFFYNNGFFYDWLMNVALSLFLLAMLVDWLSFIIIVSIGSGIGYWSHFLLHGNNNSAAIILNDPHKIHLFLYVAFFSTLIGMLFSRNKEIIQKMVVDMLEQKVKERTYELEENKLQLEQALAIKTRVLANISHEIRTPIHGVSCISQSVDDMWNELSDNERHKYVHEIAKNAMRLAKFINNILDLSKFSLGKMNFSFDRTDIVPLINDIIDEYESLYLQDKRIEIIFKANDIKSVISYADNGRITQLLRNLFGNAVRYTTEGKIIAEIKESMLGNTKAILFSLNDSGVGIAKEEMEKIFEPFYQSSRTASQAGGTGLGLAICKEIIDAHNGKIWADNNPTGGATFSFMLPVEQIE